jgi:hypothetical protein
MQYIQPSQLTDEEFSRYCYQLLITSELPKTYQEELLKRYEDALDKLSATKQ